MSESSRDATALLRAGRTAFRPEAHDRERVLVALLGAIGDAGPGPSEGGSAATAGGAGGARLAALKPWILGGVAALTVGTGALVAYHPWTRGPLRSVASAASPPPALTAEPPPPLAAESGPAAQPASNDHAGPRAASRARSRANPDSLTEEVQLLSRAEQQLNDGRAEDALKTLGEHERRFPSGALAEDRMAARVQALCTVGRTAQARGEWTKLARAYPGSPHVDRARHVCGFDTSAP